MALSIQRPAGRKAVTAALAITLLAVRCSDSKPKEPTVTVIFDDQSEPALTKVGPALNGEPGIPSRVVDPLGATTDGSLYLRIETSADTPGGDPKVFLRVRSPAGSFLPPPTEIAREGIAAMAFDPRSGDPFVLSFPGQQAHVRRFRGDRVTEDLHLTTSGDGAPLVYTLGSFPEASLPRGADPLQLFYDASSGSVLYANGDLYRVDAEGRATIAVARPVPKVPGAPVVYAVDAKRGTIYVAFEDPKLPAGCGYAYAVHRVEPGGSMTRLAGGVCGKTKHKDRDHATLGGVDGMAVEPVSGDLFWWNLTGDGLHRLAKGKVTSTTKATCQFPQGRGPCGLTPGRTTAAVGDGNIYVSFGRVIAKVTFLKGRRASPG